MIINNKTGRIAYHTLTLGENGITFKQLDYDGSEIKRPLTEYEKAIEPQTLENK